MRIRTYTVLFLLTVIIFAFIQWTDSGEDQGARGGGGEGAFR